MRQDRQVRVIKRDKRERAGGTDKEAPVPVERTSERELRTVVSGWVSEHRRRSEEFRQNYSNMLRHVGFLPPRAASRA